MSAEEKTSIDERRKYLGQINSLGAQAILVAEVPVAYGGSRSPSDLAFILRSHSATRRPRSWYRISEIASEPISQSSAQTRRGACSLNVERAQRGTAKRNAMWDFGE